MLSDKPSAAPIVGIHVRRGRTPSTAQSAVAASHKPSESNMTLVRFALGTGFLAFAAVSLSCDREAGAPDATVTVRSALNSNVVVTVVDGATLPR